MSSLRLARRAVSAPSPTWGARDLTYGCFPRVERLSGGLSLRAATRRFSRLGDLVTAFESGTKNVWTSLSRPQMTDELRRRVRNPTAVDQIKTDLCGPFAVYFEYVRRDPERFVRDVTVLVETGVLPTYDDPIEVESELLGKPAPGGLAHIDWMFTASIRDDQNDFEDLDDGKGLEAVTGSGAMLHWTRRLLGLQEAHIPCAFSGELEAIAAAQRAVDAGGVAFLTVDSDLLESPTLPPQGHSVPAMVNLRWSSRKHDPNGTSAWTASTQSKPNPGVIWANHIVPLLGDLVPADPEASGPIIFRVFSWRKEFIVSGSADDFSEYLWSVVTGLPSE